MAEVRPKIKLETQTSDFLMEVCAVAALIFTIVYVIINYNKLPATIPTHFDFSGKVDGYGDKSTLLLLPIVPAFLYILLTIINRFPQVFNYPVKITEDNAAIQYELGTRLLRVIKLLVMLLFASISYEIIASAQLHATSSEWWTLPVEVAAIIAAIAIYWRAAMKNEKKGISDAIIG